MADDKKPVSGGGAEGHSYAAGIILFMLLIVAVSGYLDNHDFGAGKDNPNIEKVGVVSRLIGLGEVSEGTEIIAKADVPVRSAPGSTILGMQDKRSEGVVKEGPISAFNVDWYRIDFEDTPDGWVESFFITSQLGKFKAVNIFPIIYSLAKPLGIGLLILIFFLIFVVAGKNKKSHKFAQDKEKLRRESAIPSYAVKTNNEVSSAASGIPNLPTGDDAPGNEVPKFEVVKNERWEHVQSLLKSSSENDWRQAILEADIILDELLTKIGYEGDGIADKLKRVSKNDFVTVQYAWDGHIIRNKIAHDGSNFELSKIEAERVIGLYEKVFKEFYYI